MFSLLWLDKDEVKLVPMTFEIQNIFFLVEKFWKDS